MRGDANCPYCSGTGERVGETRCGAPGLEKCHHKSAITHCKCGKKLTSKTHTIQAGVCDDCVANDERVFFTWLSGQL